MNLFDITHWANRNHWQLVQAGLKERIEYEKKGSRLLSLWSFWIDAKEAERQS